MASAVMRFCFEHGKWANFSALSATDFLYIRGTELCIYLSCPHIIYFCGTSDTADTVSLILNRREVYAARDDGRRLCGGVTVFPTDLSVYTSLRLHSARGTSRGIILISPVPS